MNLKNFISGILFIGLISMSSISFANISQEKSEKIRQYYTEYKIVPEVKCIKESSECSLLKEIAKLQREVHKLRLNKRSLIIHSLNKDIELITVKTTIELMQSEKKFSVRCVGNLKFSSSIVRKLACYPKEKTINSAVNLQQNEEISADDIIEKYNISNYYNIPSLIVSK